MNTDDTAALDSLIAAFRRAVATKDVALAKALCLRANDEKAGDTGKWLFGQCARRGFDPVPGRAVSEGDRGLVRCGFVKVPPGPRLASELVGGVIADAMWVMCVRSSAPADLPENYGGWRVASAARSEAMSALFLAGKIDAPLRWEDLPQSLDAQRFRLEPKEIPGLKEFAEIPDVRVERGKAVGLPAVDRHAIPVTFYRPEGGEPVERWVILEREGADLKVRAVSRLPQVGALLEGVHLAVGGETEKLTPEQMKAGFERLLGETLTKLGVSKNPDGKLDFSGIDPTISEDELAGIVRGLLDKVPEALKRG